MILLNTHAWVWWVSEPAQLSQRARRVVDEAAAQAHLFISSISAWEVALLVAKGRLKLNMEVGDWVSHSEALPFVSFVLLNNHPALTSVTALPPLHADPADRIIIATALYLGADIVTKDSKIAGYPKVKAIW